MNNVSHRVEDCLNSEDVSTNVLKDLDSFHKLLCTLTLTAPSETHYHRLDEWCDAVFGYVHNMLKKYKFINGGDKQNPNARFWWKIYGVVSNVIYSPNLKTTTEPHHASALERNEALKLDVEQILSHLKIK